MVRAKIAFAVFNAEGQPQSGRTATLTKANGSPLTQTVYDAPSGGSVITQLTSDPDGLMEGWADLGEEVLATVSGESAKKQSFYPDAGRIVVQNSSIAVVLDALNSNTDPALTVRNLHASGDQLVLKGSDGTKTLRVKGKGAHILHTSAVDGVTFQAQDDDGVALPFYLQSAVGPGLALIQNGWGTEENFGLQIARLLRTSDSAASAAPLSAQIEVSDGKSAGADPVAGKFLINSSGLYRTSARAIEAIAQRFLADINTAAGSAYGAIAAADGDIGSTRAICATLSVDSALTAILKPYTVAVDAVGVLVYSGSQDASVAGRTWTTRSGAVGIYFGADGSNRLTQGGWDFAFIGDTTPTGVLAGPPATRYTHLRTTGGADMFYLAQSDTTGIGARLVNLEGGHTRDIYVGGSLSGYTGGLIFRNLQDSRFMGVFARSASVDQLLLQDGTDALPSLAGQGDPDTGVRWGTAANVLTLIAGGSAKAYVNANGLGAGGQAPSNVVLYVSSGASNPGVRLDGSANFATTVGAAGGASALPATPLGYWIVNFNGTLVKVPYYPAS